MQNGWGFKNKMATINGDGGDNVLNGTSFDDIINGLDANDDIFGHEGNDVLNGGNGNGRVEFSEVAGYVKNNVPLQINRLGHRQYPTAAPIELLDFARIPMTLAGDQD